MKKHLLTALLLTSTTLLTGCNIIQAAKLSTIAGTYKLIRYEVTTRYVGPDMEELDEPRTVNVLKEDGIVNYVTITSNNGDFGYYGYKDNFTSAYVQTMLQDYRYESEDSELIEEVAMMSNLTIYNFYVQGRRKTLTNNSPAWRGSIHIGSHDYTFGNNDKVMMKWKRVSSNQTESYILGKLGVSSSLPFVNPYA